MELNRILRPGGFFIWSATPVYLKNERDTPVWNGMSTMDLFFRLVRGRSNSCFSFTRETGHELVFDLSFMLLCSDGSLNKIHVLEGSGQDYGIAERSRACSVPEACFIILLQGTPTK